MPLALKLIADAGRDNSAIVLDPLQFFRSGDGLEVLRDVRAHLAVHTIQRWPTRWPAMRTRHGRRAAPRYPRCSTGWSADQRGMVPAARHDTVGPWTGRPGHCSSTRRFLDGHYSRGEEERR